MLPDATLNQAEALSAACRSKRIKLATAGVCTPAIRDAA